MGSFREIRPDRSGRNAKLETAGELGSFRIFAGRRLGSFRILGRGASGNWVRFAEKVAAGHLVCENWVRFVKIAVGLWPLAVGCWSGGELGSFRINSS